MMSRVQSKDIDLYTAPKQTKIFDSCGLFTELIFVLTICLSSCHGSAISKCLLPLMLIAILIKTCQYPFFVPGFWILPESLESVHSGCGG